MSNDNLLAPRRLRAPELAPDAGVECCADPNRASLSHTPAGAVDLEPLERVLDRSRASMAQARATVEQPPLDGKPADIGRPDEFAMNMPPIGTKPERPIAGDIRAVCIHAL